MFKDKASWLDDYSELITQSEQPEPVGAREMRARPRRRLEIERPNTTARMPHIRERLDMWGRWLATGRASTGSSSLAMLANQSGRYRSFVPLDEIECSITDDAVRALPIELRDAVTTWHTSEGTLESTAEQLKICRMTLCRQLRHADERLSEWLATRAERQALQRRNNQN